MLTAAEARQQWEARAAAAQAARDYAEQVQTEQAEDAAAEAEAACSGAFARVMVAERQERKQ